MINWKVPFRSCYADSFAGWVKYTLWCHVVLPVYSDWIPVETSAEVAS